MNLFQMIALPIVLLLLLRDCVRLLRGGHHRSAVLLSVVTWLTAMIAIWNPGITLSLAHVLGIGRGTDLVVYFVAIAFIASTFYFYNQVVRLRSEITSIVRTLAIERAEKNLRDAEPPPVSPGGQR